MQSNQLQGQTQLFGDFVYDRLIPSDHLLRRMNDLIDFSLTDKETKQFFA